jgi:hypothetical protein
MKAAGYSKVLADINNEKILNHNFEFVQALTNISDLKKNNCPG